MSENRFLVVAPTDEIAKREGKPTKEEEEKAAAAEAEAKAKEEAEAAATEAAEKVATPVKGDASKLQLKGKLSRELGTEGSCPSVTLKALRYH